MSKYFVVDPSDGKAKDIIWRKTAVANIRVVYLDDKPIGEIHRMGAQNYCPIAYADRKDLIGLRSVSGFRTRWYATEYILAVSGYRRDL